MERDDLGSFAPLRGREASQARRRYSELMHTKTSPDYSGFAQEASRLNFNDFSASTERKRDLLRQFFPGRYKTHHWAEMDGLQISSLFSKMYDYSEKHQH